MDKLIVSSLLKTVYKLVRLLISWYFGSKSMDEIL